MSPELASGERVDHRADLWALGVVLCEMLAGRPPFTSESLEALFHAILWRKPERVTALRPERPADRRGRAERRAGGVGDLDRIDA